MRNHPPTVFVVDDDISIRESLDTLLRLVGWRVETFDSAREFLNRPPLLAPSCLVLDVNLPDLSGLDLQQRIGSDRAHMPIIFVTGYGDIPTTVQAMKAGASEFLTKPLNADVLVSAVLQALERSSTALHRADQLKTLRDRHAKLSTRERQIMALVVSGRLNKQIAYELGISEITVKVHRGRVMRKMEAKSLADLVSISSKLDLSPELEAKPLQQS